MTTIQNITCRRCKTNKPLSEYDKQVGCTGGVRKTCKSCRGELQKIRYRREPEVRAKQAVHRKNSALKAKYGISREQYDEMNLRQEHLCAICKKECVRHDVLSVDHDHETGRVRGLLCDPCNRMLACARDSIDLLESAARYLESF